MSPSITRRRSRRQAIFVFRPLSAGAMSRLATLKPAARAGCGWVESELGFPNQRDFDSTCWLGGGQQEMAKPYSQDLRDRVIDAVKKGEMSRRAAARRYEISESVAIKWLERVERDGSRAPVGHGGHRASKLMPHRDFLEAARAEKSDVTLQALCDRLSAERGVKADTSMMSRFFRRIGVTVKKRPSSRASRIAQTSAATANDGEPIRASSTPGGWSSSMKPGPRPT